jgi:hypothetical protein
MHEDLKIAVYTFNEAGEVFIRLALVGSHADHLLAVAYFNSTEVKREVKTVESD